MDSSLLLISPPMRHPITADAATQALAAALEADGMTVVRFDAGHDFYRRFVLAAAPLRGALEFFVRRWQQGVYGAAPPEILALASDLRVNERQWLARIERAPQLANVLDAGEARVLFDTAASLESIDHLLRFLSTVFFPLRLERDSLVHPGLERIADVADFCRQESQNPFVRYARWADLPMPGDLALCLVQRPDQVAVVASLIAAWRQRWPETTWAAAGAPPWADAVHRAVGITMEDLPNGQAALRQDVQRLYSEDRQDGGDSGGKTKEPLFEPDTLVREARLDPAALTGMQDRGTSVIVWRDPQGEFKPITAGLYQVARGGTWNHLLLPPEGNSPLAFQLSAFAAENPGIVHSWCLRTLSASPYSGPRRKYPRGSVPYGQTAPLPGLPIWQILQHPALIAAFLRRQGLKSLAQLRYDPEAGIIFELGRFLAYTYQKPAELPDGYLDEICRMVEAGGSVATQWVRHNLQRAFLIVYVQEYGVIVGNSSLKHPRQEYIEAVSAQSGIDLHHYLERGYTSVRPEYRGFGIGAQMLAGLTERAGDYKIFSVIGEDNIPTQKMAIRNRTRKVATFYSERANKQIGVWIPEWMLPEGIDLPPQPQLD